ncbi:hypothetical protein L9F63_013413, partial [Diploptera punctata]
CRKNILTFDFLITFSYPSIHIVINENVRMAEWFVRVLVLFEGVGKQIISVNALVLLYRCRKSIPTFHFLITLPKY